MQLQFAQALRAWTDIDSLKCQEYNFLPAPPIGWGGCVNPHLPRWLAIAVITGASAVVK
jgi:hypothetical protein